MTNDEIKDVWKAIIVWTAGGIVVGIVAGIGVGTVAGSRLEQKAAIEANAGRWVIDSKTGAKTFVYGCKGGVE
jgi:hypothetical protein